MRKNIAEMTILRKIMFPIFRRLNLNMDGSTISPQENYIWRHGFIKDIGIMVRKGSHLS